MAEYKKENVNDIFRKINGLNDISKKSKKEDEELKKVVTTKVTFMEDGTKKREIISDVNREVELYKKNIFQKINMNTKYSYNDIMVKPAILSTIEHRAECNPYDENGMLPLFTAPMDTVVSTKNFELFEKNGIIPILPRTESLEDRINYACDNKWAAFSLQEFEEEFTTGKLVTTDNIKALIDIANGHVARLYNLVRKAKKIYGKNITIMVGNIANPETYRVCVESQVDFVRCSVGTGCFTEDAIVKTDGGDKKISEIKVGDKVLTHKNKYEEVIDTISYRNTNKLMKINGVKCTANHKFYVINKEDIERAKNDVEHYAFWVEAEKLDKTKHLLIKLE